MTALDWEPRYDGDTLYQFLLDTECGRYEGDGPGMSRHLRTVHGIPPVHDGPWCQSIWSEVAAQHVEAHIDERNDALLDTLAAWSGDHLDDGRDMIWHPDYSPSWGDGWKLYQARRLLSVRD